MTITTTDERTLADLQREHGPALLHFLLGLTFGDRQRAEDLLQETLVRSSRTASPRRSTRVTTPSCTATPSVATRSPRRS
ncbi:hypothetical protein ACWCPL_43600, partial [Streptomyces sp. NPDC001948]